MIDICFTRTRNIPIIKEKNRKKQYYTPTQYSSQKKESDNVSSYIKESDFLFSGQTAVKR